MKILHNIRLIGWFIFFEIFKIKKKISETDLDQSDADIKVRVLKDKLKDKQKEARRLRAQLGSSLDRCDETVASLGKQEALRQQINRIDNIIAEVKSQISIASLVDEEPGLKPRIRSPSKDSSVSSNSR